MDAILFYLSNIDMYMDFINTSIHNGSWYFTKKKHIFPLQGSATAYNVDSNVVIAAYYTPQTPTTPPPPSSDPAPTGISFVF
jgi:hypothetical protein